MSASRDLLRNLGALDRNPRPLADESATIGALRSRRFLIVRCSPGSLARVCRALARAALPWLPASIEASPCSCVAVRVKPSGWLLPVASRVPCSGEGVPDLAEAGRIFLIPVVGFCSAAPSIVGFGLVPTSFFLRTIPPALETNRPVNLKMLLRPSASVVDSREEASRFD